MHHVLRDAHAHLRLTVIGSYDELAVWLNNRPDAAARPIRIVLGRDIKEDIAFAVHNLIRERKLAKCLMLYTQQRAPTAFVNGKSVLASADPMRAAEFAVHVWPAAL